MLKIKDNVDLKELEKFGFDDVDANLAKEELYTSCYGEFDYEFDNTYSKFIAYGRRGQEYYILVDKNTRLICIYATKPDGSGCKGELDNTIINLFQAGLVDKIED